MHQRGAIPCWISIATVVLLLSSPTGAALNDSTRATAYPRTNYSWPYASGPVYGTVEPGSFRAPGVVHTAVGSFQLRTVSSTLPDALTTTNRLDRIDSQYFIIQLHPDSAMSGNLDDLRRAIEERGGVIVRWVPVAAMLARLTSEAYDAARSAPGLMTIEPFHPAFKLDPTVGRTPLVDPERAASDVYELDVQTFAGEDTHQVANRLAALGAKVLRVFPNQIRLEIHRSRLAAVASLEPVSMVFEHVPMRPHAEKATAAIQTGGWNQGAKPFHDAGIDGGGGESAQPQILMVLDTGIQLDAGDLALTRTEAGTAGGAHRKVLLYESTNQFGGLGDLQGCDAPPLGGYTHGHLVASMALGWASEVEPGYGDGWWAVNPSGHPWKMDGVAPRALLVAYDGQQTPVAASCADPMHDTIAPGTLYFAPAGGSLGDAYVNHAARVFNLSWGSTTNAYMSNSYEIDEFLNDHREAMVIVSAGNAGSDADENGIPDEGKVGAPATSKNALVIGASGSANDPGDALESRLALSSVGPVVGERVAPLLMAPGGEEGATRIDALSDPWAELEIDETLGLASAFGCRSSDNDQNDPVECDVVAGRRGTSYAAATAAGALLLVRDYFAQGFYPDGTAENPDNLADQVSNPSGTLGKALLIASSDFMTGGGLTKDYRFNNEQGYGRIQLDRVLPLDNWPTGPNGLIVSDGIPAGVNDLGLIPQLSDFQSTSAEFEICDETEELRVALVWIDPQGMQTMVNDLDLTLVAPDGTTYWGNYFTDDNDRSGALDPGEDCPGFGGATGVLEQSQWSLPTCPFSIRDMRNPTEAIFLSPDPDGDGEIEDGLSQVAPGDWTLTVNAPGPIMSGPQPFAVVVTGGVCQQSSVTLDATVYTCNALAKLTVLELSDAGDVAPTVADIESRTTVEVFSGTTLVDCEGPGCSPPITELAFQQPDPSVLTFVSDALQLTAGTARDPGNGVLDARNGDTIRVVYQDHEFGSPDPNKARHSIASVDCSVDLGFGTVFFSRFGQDAGVEVVGGCERNAREEFNHGYPDAYMDAGEILQYRVAFQNNEPGDLENVEVSLRCVDVDTDSPAGCRPDSTDCPDPRRENNTLCNGTPNDTDPAWIEVLDSPRFVGYVPAGSALAANFVVAAAETITGEPHVEMVVEVRATHSGRSRPGIAVNRHRLDVDEESLFYSTDFPMGGVEIFDWNENEIADDPTSAPGDPEEDYRFETRLWSDLTLGIGPDNQSDAVNLDLQSPWNFDVSDGGFTTGLASISDFATVDDVIANWGEDTNFNRMVDGFCELDPSVWCITLDDCATAGVGGPCTLFEDRDPDNGALDQNWSTEGGCGWQTMAPGSCSGNPDIGCYADGDCPVPQVCSGPALAGGVWHTGRIGEVDMGQCMVGGDTFGQCQLYEVIGDMTGERAWWELLVTPVITKVNRGVDGEGLPTHRVQILDWAWNQSVDLADEWACYTWEFDTDVAELLPVDLKTDGTVLDYRCGPFGAANSSLSRVSDRFPLFATPGQCEGSGEPCLTDDDCQSGPCTDTGTSVNGSVGNNRVGRNSCFFEEAFIFPETRSLLRLAGPRDDDQDNDSNGVIDEFVMPNGPLRNAGVTDAWDLDMRFNTLEDLYGETGDSFQGAIGFLNLEGDLVVGSAQGGFGLAVDDMVVQWREYSLVPDTTECGSGSCATIEFGSTNLFEGETSLAITVLDVSPVINDCDCDGEHGGSDDFDCDDNGIDDVTILVSSDADRPGECVVLDQTTPGRYVGELAVSATVNLPGVLFVQKTGLGDPTVRAVYMDEDDGTGQSCRKDPDPEKRGRVEASTEVYLSHCVVSAFGAVLSDNGDNDGFADTNETVDIRLKIRNACGFDLDQCEAFLWADDPEIDCVVDSSIAVGSIAHDAEILTTESFVFHVAADANRTDVYEDFTAELHVSISCEQIAIQSHSQIISLPLDLDATGGAAPTTYVEDFEGPGLGNFSIQNLDEELHGAPAIGGPAEGSRCQYSDPGWSGSNVFGHERADTCYPGATPAQAAATHWQIEDSRSYNGDYALYFGIEGFDGFDYFTTPLAALEAAATTDPIHLDHALGSSPELSFKHQISLVGGRNLGWSESNEAIDRAVVQVQIADHDDLPVGDWIKAYPYKNGYRTWPEDIYRYCTFDPIDDGSTEDDFFDPTDPEHRFGRSSTCLPEPVFAWQGDTSRPFAESNLGLAEGPGLRGDTGVGTWVESKVDLSRFRGHSVRLRFLATSIKVDDFADYQELLGWNPTDGDDGWWIDEVWVTHTLVLPAELMIDTKNNAALTGCGPTCGSITIVVALDPPESEFDPGEALVVDASGSYADRCVDGMLQFRFYREYNGEEGFQDGDVLLRGWTGNPLLRTAVEFEYTVGVEVRCSSDPTCPASSAKGVGTRLLAVICRESGNLTPVGSFASLAGGDGLIHPASTFEFSWVSPIAGTWVSGALEFVEFYPIEVIRTIENESSFFDRRMPRPDKGFYFVAAAGDGCQTRGTWDNPDGMAPGRDPALP